jgi:UDP-3-O-[3-hydroxymyristoyl] glucosamine N-acyltransferase
MTLSALDIADLTGGTLRGPGGTAVDGISALAAAGPRHLAFVDDAKALPAALASAAGVVIAGGFAGDAVRPAGALVVCDQPRLAFARMARRLAPGARPDAGAHPSAIVDGTAALGHHVSIDAHAVIDADVRLGDRVVVGPGVHLGAGVVVGEDSILRSNVVIYSGTSIGARVIVHAGSVLGSDGFGYVRDAATGRYEAFPQVGRLVIENDVEIGALCTVDRGALGETRIERGTKLDNQVHVAHNVSIGQDVVIAAQTGVAGSSVIEDQVVVAGQVGIADHARIESGAILGAQCGVPTGKVIKGPGVLFWGTPARPIKEYLRELAVLSRLAKKRKP